MNFSLIDGCGTRENIIKFVVILSFEVAPVSSPIL